MSDRATRVEVEVTLPPLLRDAVEGGGELRVSGATLAGALEALREDHPRLRVHLWDEQGRTRKHVLLFFNGDNLAWLPSLDVPLRPGDTLHVLQAVSGG